MHLPEKYLRSKIQKKRENNKIIESYNKKGKNKKYKQSKKAMKKGIV